VAGGRGGAQASRERSPASKEQAQRPDMKHFLADTHALLFFLSHPNRLGSAARRAFDGLGTTSTIHVSSLSLWETALLHEKGQLHLAAGYSAWSDALAQEPGIQVESLLPADVEQARALAHLPDPFDRLIAGTALRLGVPIISKDSRMKRGGRVRLVW
jgi:PIN domain nuclease of toxin-antitoxin system